MPYRHPKTGRFITRAQFKRIAGAKAKKTKGRKKPRAKPTPKKRPAKRRPAPRRPVPRKAPVKKRKKRTRKPRAPRLFRDNPEFFFDSTDQEVNFASFDFGDLGLDREFLSGLFSGVKKNPYPVGEEPDSEDAGGAIADYANQFDKRHAATGFLYNGRFPATTKFTRVEMFSIFVSSDGEVLTLPQFFPGGEGAGIGRTPAEWAAWFKKSRRQTPDFNIHEWIVSQLMVDKYEREFGGEWRLFQVLGFSGVTSLTEATQPKRKRKKSKAKKRKVKKRKAKRR